MAKRPNEPPSPPSLPPPINWVSRTRWADMFGLLVLDGPMRVVPGSFHHRAAEYRDRLAVLGSVATMRPRINDEAYFRAARQIAVDVGLGDDFDRLIAERERPHPSWAERQASRR